MKVPISTQKTAILYMQQGYFDEAEKVLLALEAEDPNDPELPGLKERLMRSREEALLNPPIQMLEREENLEDEILSAIGQTESTVPRQRPGNGDRRQLAGQDSSVRGGKLLPFIKEGGLVSMAGEVGLEIAQRTLDKLPRRLSKRLNRVLSKIQERKRGF